MDLASSTPVLGFEIVAHGRRVFARDALAADEAEERCLRETWTPSTCAASSTTTSTAIRSELHDWLARQPSHI